MFSGLIPSVLSRLISSILIGDVTVTTGNVRIWAETAGSSTGGGAGGDVEVSIGDKLTVQAGTLQVFGGIGSEFGGDGKGGDMTVTAGSMDIAGVATLRGGANTNDGPAGYMTMTLTDSNEKSWFHNDLVFTGTNGRSLGTGGNATLNAGSVDVRVDGNLQIASGDGNNTNAAGTGGNAEFRANTLELGGANNTVRSGTAYAAAPGNITVAVTTLKSVSTTAAMQVTKNNGPVSFTADTINATEGNLTLGFVNTNVTTGDTVAIGNLAVGNGQTLAVTSPANTMTLNGGLQVTAYDAANPDLLATSTYTGSGPAATDFSGKPLGFAFPLNIANNSTVLTTPDPLTIDNTTQVSLSMTGSGPLQLSDGDEIILASNIGASTYSPRLVMVNGNQFEVLSDGGQLIAIFRGPFVGPTKSIPVNPAWMLLLLGMTIIGCVSKRFKHHR